MTGKMKVSKTNRKQPVQRLYALKDAAKYMGRSSWGMHELRWKGKLPYIQDGKKIYFDVKDLDQYIDNLKVQNTQ